MKWMPDTPPPSPTPPRYPWERGQLHSAGCCLRDPSQSTCAFSDGQFFNALADEDFDLLQLTEEKRPELVAVVNQEGNDTTHTTGESILHVYFAHLKTSYVDWAKHSRIKWYVMGLKSSSPTILGTKVTGKKSQKESHRPNSHRREVTTLVLLYYLGSLP